MLASVGLLVVLSFAFFLSGAAVMGTGNCDTSPDNVLCDEQGWTIATRGPVISAAVGCLIGLIGAWIWPRRSKWLWLTAGYLVVGVGVVTVRLWLDHIATRLTG